MNRYTHKLIVILSILYSCILIGCATGGEQSQTKVKRDLTIKIINSFEYDSQAPLQLAMGLVVESAVRDDALVIPQGSRITGYYYNDDKNNCKIAWDRMTYPDGGRLTDGGVLAITLCESNQVIEQGDVVGAYWHHLNN